VVETDKEWEPAPNAPVPVLRVVDSFNGTILLEDSLCFLVQKLRSIRDTELLYQLDFDNKYRFFNNLLL
jgi:hypothetical protein